MGPGRLVPLRGRRRDREDTVATKAENVQRGMDKNSGALSRIANSPKKGSGNASSAPSTTTRQPSKSAGSDPRHPRHASQAARHPYPPPPPSPPPPTANTLPGVRQLTSLFAAAAEKQCGKPDVPLGTPLSEEVLNFFQKRGISDKCVERNRIFMKVCVCVCVWGGGGGGGGPREECMTGVHVFMNGGGWVA